MRRIISPCLYPDGCVPRRINKKRGADSHTLRTIRTAACRRPGTDNDVVAFAELAPALRKILLGSNNRARNLISLAARLGFYVSAHVLQLQVAFCVCVSSVVAFGCYLMWLPHAF